MADNNGPGLPHETDFDISSQQETLGLIQSLLDIQKIVTIVPTNGFGKMTTAITSTTLTTVESPPPITSGSSFSNLQLLQQAPNLANPPAPYSPAFISTLPKRYTTTTHTNSSPEFPFQQRTLPGSGQLPEHQHYLGVSSQLQF